MKHQRDIKVDVTRVISPRTVRFPERGRQIRITRVNRDRIRQLTRKTPNKARIRGIAAL